MEREPEKKEKSIVVRGNQSSMVSWKLQEESIKENINGVIATKRSRKIRLEKCLLDLTCIF